MSGPKCDEIELSFEEEERIREEYEERLRQEAERLKRERERKRREQERLERERLEAERIRREEEERIRREERLRAQAKSYDEAVAQRLARLQEERDRAAEAMRRIEPEEYADRAAGKERGEGGTSDPDRDQNAAKFDRAAAEYEAAALLAGLKPKVPAYDPLHGSEQIEWLRAACERIKADTVAEACQEQADAWIDQTIEDMGYHILAQRETDGRQHAVSRLYQYDADTAIHVIRAGGQFTMEVVAVDSVSREPDEKERRHLTNTMERFCGDYERIREGLQASGRLRARQVFHLPPAPEYAAVVNRSGWQKVNRESGSNGEAGIAQSRTTGTVSRDTDYMTGVSENKEARLRSERG